VLVQCYVALCSAVWCFAALCSATHGCDDALLCRLEQCYGDQLARGVTQETQLFEFEFLADAGRALQKRERLRVCLCVCVCVCECVCVCVCVCGCQKCTQLSISIIRHIIQV
jgi:hypothetical protein